MRRGRTAFLASLVTWLSSIPVAHANECFLSGPHYRLESDTVEWQMKIPSGQNCVRGVRFDYVWNGTISLVSPPQFGRVSLVGSYGFSYTAKSDFHGEDVFVVGISGSKYKTTGISTIRVVVSVMDNPHGTTQNQGHDKIPTSVSSVGEVTQEHKRENIYGSSRPTDAALISGNSQAINAADMN